MTTKPGDRLEINLILCCARSSLDDERSERIRAQVSEDIDWSYLTYTAEEHGVTPLVYRSLKIACPGSVPEIHLDHLRTRCYENMVRSLFLSAELLRILDSLRSHGIRAIPFKGPILSSILYGDVGIRVFDDLDILVHQEDLPRTKEALESLDYRPVLQLTPAMESYYFKLRHQHTFHRSDKKAVVEAHGSLFSPSYSFSMDLERLWARVERTRFEGRDIETLAQEDLVLYLCLHGAKHCWYKLEWICDLAELAGRQVTTNWNRIMSESERSGGRRMLSLGLLLAHDLLQAPFPDDVMSWVRRDPSVETLAAAVPRDLFAENSDPLELESGRHWLFYLKTMTRTRDRALFCRDLALMPSSIELESLPLPRFLVPLYYLFRPIRLALKYVGRALGR